MSMRGHGVGGLKAQPGGEPDGEDQSHELRPAAALVMHGCGASASSRSADCRGWLPVPYW